MRCFFLIYTLFKEGSQLGEAVLKGSFKMFRVGNN